MAVFFCDLNSFRRVNDSLGHRASDELLAAVAQRLSAKLPAKCTPARFYGDEFVVLCSNVDFQGGVESLTREACGLFQMDVSLHQRVVHVSASVGSAVVEDAEMSRPS